MDQQASPNEADQVAAKRAAGQAAVDAIPDGALIGLGSGSTAELMLEALGARVRAGLRVTGVATSERTASLAAALGIPLVALDALDPARQLDLSIDGADEVALPTLDVLKGRGGALLREKFIASISRFRIIIVDSSKLGQPGSRFAIPVEIEPFGWRQTMARVATLGCAPVRRIAHNAQADDAYAAPFISDGGHYILDCAFPPEVMRAPADIADKLKRVTGVVDSGLFIGLTDRLYVGGADGVRVYNRQE